MVVCNRAPRPSSCCHDTGATWEVGWTIVGRGNGKQCVELRGGKEVGSEELMDGKAGKLSRARLAEAWPVRYCEMYREPLQSHSGTGQASKEESRQPAVLVPHTKAVWDSFPSLVRIPYKRLLVGHPFGCQGLVKTL